MFKRRTGGRADLWIDGLLGIVIARNEVTKQSDVTVVKS